MKGMIDLHLRRFNLARRRKKKLRGSAVVAPLLNLEQSNKFHIINEKKVAQRDRNFYQDTSEK